SWVGIGFPLAGGARAVGLSLGTFGFSDQPVYTVDQPDGTGQTYSVAETFVQATYGQNFSDRFSAGFSVKFINDKLADTRAGAFAVDFGTNFHATIGERPIRAAFVLQNLGSQLRHDGPGPGAGAGLEWAGTNLGNSGFSLAGRGSYTIQPANNISDIDLQGITTSQSSGSFTSYGLAVGGGISYGKGDFKLGFDYAWRDLGLLGGTNYLSFSVGW